MLCDRTQLIDLVQKLRASLLQYVRWCSLWIEQDGAALKDALAELIAREETAVRELEIQLHGEEHIWNDDIFPSEFGAHNFVAWTFLAPRLIVAQERSCGLVCAAAEGVSRHDPVRRTVQQLLETEEHILNSLRELAKPVVPAR